MAQETVNPFDSGAWAGSEDETTTATDNSADTSQTDNGSETKNDANSSVDSQDDKKDDNGQTDPQGQSQTNDGNSTDGDGSSSTGHTEQDTASDDVQPKLEFKNDLSKQIFDAILSGNYNEIAPIIYEQSILSNLDKLSNDDVLKLQIKYENPKMSDEEVINEFNNRYGYEEEKIDKEFMTDEEIKAHEKNIAKEKRAIEKEMRRDAKEAIKFLEEKRQDISIPDINEFIKNSAPKPIDNSKEIEEYNQMIEAERKKYEDSIEPSLDKVSNFEVDYKDDELGFKVAFQPQKEDMAGMKDKLKSFTLEDYFGPRYYNQEKGEYNTAKLAEDIYWMENREKIVKSIVAQAVSSTKADMLKKIKGVNVTDAPSARNTGSSTPSEIDDFVNKLYSM